MAQSRAARNRLDFDVLGSPVHREASRVSPPHPVPWLCPHAPGCSWNQEADAAAPGCPMGHPSPGDLAASAPRGRPRRPECQGGRPGGAGGVPCLVGGHAGPVLLHELQQAGPPGLRTHVRKEVCGAVAGAGAGWERLGESRRRSMRASPWCPFVRTRSMSGVDETAPAAATVQMQHPPGRYF
jgi:hypothetical protein